MATVLAYGWYINGGDVSFNRLIGDASDGYGFDNPKYPVPNPFEWWYVMPPLVLLVITRFGIPVSTTFMILTFFSPKNLGDMLVKSLVGYGVAFVAAIVFYFLIAKILEKKFAEKGLKKSSNRKFWWTVAQWVATGFLWSQWLMQDFANIYVYLPRQLSVVELLVSMSVLVGLLGFVFYQRGGAIQKIVKSKRNTSDVRSATFIDLLFGVVLFYFKEVNSIPMSTTWVFLGLLAGREYALHARLEKEKFSKKVHRVVMFDLGKVTLGLLVSVGLVAGIHYLKAF